tara:strand:+ start:382 stop:1782 length:1401 start_codon:yes stop_codon:yes gene_type:complete
MKDWSSVYIGCSGSFKLEQAIRQRYSDIRIVSNDISLWTGAIAGFLTDKHEDFDFINELEFIEDLIRKNGNDYPTRVAAVLFVQAIKRFRGNNPYSQKHYQNMIDNASDFLQTGVQRLAELKALNPVDEYFAGDWRVHAKNAAEEGAGFLTFPPFVVGHYEKSEFAWLLKNTNWKEPPYETYDPLTLEDTTEEIDKYGNPYVVLSGHLFKNRRPDIEFKIKRKNPHYCYTNTGKSSVRHLYRPAHPFNYKLPDPKLIKRDSKCTVTVAGYQECNYIKDIYLARGITHSPGAWSRFVWIEDMLVGIIVYNWAPFTVRSPDGGVFGNQTRKRCMYILSDTVTSRECKLSKLVVLLACCKEVLRPIEISQLQTVDYLCTTARSRNPSSMKYRDIMELISRKPFEEDYAKVMLEPGYEYNPNKYVLQYGKYPENCSISSIYERWFDRYSGLSKTKNQNTGRRGRRAKATV